MLTKDEIKEVIRLRQANYLSFEIAKKMGLKRTQVYSILNSARKYGIDIPSGNTSYKGAFEELLEEDRINTRRVHR